MQPTLPEDYFDDIPVAIANGHIVPIPPDEANEASLFYSHAHGITPNNARLLSIATRRVFTESRYRIRNVLELGPGSGAGVGEIKTLSPDAQISTIGGGCPINPYLPFSKDMLAPRHGYLSSVYINLLEALAEIGIGPTKVGPQALQEGFQMQELLKVHGAGHVQVFDVRAHTDPFIERQLVGPLTAGTLAQLEGEFDFIFEYQGPIHHTSRYRDKPKRDRLLKELVEATCERLSNNGVLLVDIPEETLDKVLTGLKVSATSKFSSLVARK